MIGFHYRENVRGLSPWLEDELDRLIEGTRAWFLSEHGSTGAHTTVTAQTLTLSGNLTMVENAGASDTIRFRWTTPPLSSAYFYGYYTAYAHGTIHLVTSSLGSSRVPYDERRTAGAAGSARMTLTGSQDTDANNILEGYVTDTGFVRAAGLKATGDGIVVLDGTDSIKLDAPTVWAVKNLGINGTSFGTSADGVLSLEVGTAPSTSPANVVQFYAKDVAGSAVAFVRLEDGTEVALDGSWTPPGSGAGSGDVVGPAGATADNVVFFNGTTGKLIKDSGLTLSGSNTGDQTITLTGDVTGTGTGSFATTIAVEAVTYAKMQHVSATDKLLGRESSGAGDVEEIDCTGLARTLLDDATQSDMLTTLGIEPNGRVITASATESATEKVLVCNKATDMTVTLLAATASWRWLRIVNIGAGTVTVEGDGSDTINDESSQFLRQWEAMQLVDYASGKWVVV